MNIAITLALAATTAAASNAGTGDVSVVEARVAVRGAELAVSLALPIALSTTNPGQPVPVVLILPGSGPATRAESRSFAEPFLKAGIAVLTIDKRGCGASSGSWLTSSLEDMAADGRVLLDWLKARAEVDGARVGLVGVSQGGWVAPLVAAGRSDVAFLITLTGGGISPRATETFDYERNLQRGGVSGPALLAARKTIGAYFDFLSGKAPRSEIVALLDSGKDQGWPEALGINRVLPSDSQRPAWSWVATFDPGPSISSLRIPVLTLIGGRDRDPAAEVGAWQAALLENGDPRTEIRVVPSVGHVLTLGESHMRRDFNNQALAAMASWAAAIVRL